MPCYRWGASGHKPYECSYLINRFQCNNCNRTGHKALVCFQPRLRGRGRTAFQPRGSSHTQRRTHNSFQPLRVSSGKFTRFLLREVSGLQLSHYIKESEFTSSGFIVHAIQNVSPIQYTVEVNSTPISMIVNSGSCYSLLNFDWWNRVGRPILCQGPILKHVSRNFIPVFGVANVEVRLSN